MSAFSLAFQDAAARVTSSVVPVYSEKLAGANELPFDNDFFRRFFGDIPEGRVPDARPQRGIGSGVIVSEDGYILTNNHVVDDADKVTVVLDGKNRHVAAVIGTDPQSDLAVIKVDAHALNAAILGDSDAVSVGQWVIAVGNPFELTHTVTTGIVSATGRSSVGLANFENFIQTDASINPGNSGGALVDLDGRVIGINTAISSPSGGNVGIGFAIPINMARNVMQQLIDTGSGGSRVPGSRTSGHRPRASGCSLVALDGGCPCRRRYAGQSGRSRRDTPRRRTAIGRRPADPGQRGTA